jgi:transcriptional regulator with XRE-family HTH domain
MLDSERLRIERARQRLTVRQLAKKAGVNPGTISELERGVREPYPATLGKIAAALNIPVEELTRAPLGEAPPLLQQSFNHLLAEERRAGGELLWPDERFRRLVAEAPAMQLRSLVKALTGNAPAQILEDFRIDKDAAMRAGIERVKVFACAEIVREELLARGDQDPAEYLPDFKARLEALDID